jgi:hypothetical protein
MRLMIVLLQGFQSAVECAQHLFGCDCIVPTCTKALYLDHLMGNGALGIRDQELGFREPLHLGTAVQGTCSVMPLDATDRIECRRVGGHLLI